MSENLGDKSPAEANLQYMKGKYWFELNLTFSFTFFEFFPSHIHFDVSTQAILILCWY